MFARACIVLLALSVTAHAAPVPLDIDREVADRDGDGFVEGRASAIGGQSCGCACPIVGAGLQADVAGQSVYAYGITILVVCGTGVWVDFDPGMPDPTAPPRVQPLLYIWP